MICTKTKQWGNSIGVIIPNNIVKDLGLKPNEEICFEVSKKKGNVLKELFGALPKGRPVEQVLKDARKNESKYY